MAKEKFITFQRFNQPADALELVELLKENNVDHEFVNNTPSFDPSFANNELTHEYRVKLRRMDFGRADDLLLQAFSKQLDRIDKSHYLFAFSDEELQDVVSKRDEWSPLDFLLAQKILRQRGKEIKAEEVSQLKKKRIKELAKPKKIRNYWVFRGYIFALLGGLVGIAIGWHLLMGKKTLPNGDQVYSYPVSDRKHGLRILIISVVCFIGWVVYRVARNMG
jgi:hypothetical protein